MKKTICMLLLIQGGFMMAQTKTVVTVNGEKVTVNPNAIGTADNGLTATSGNIQLGGSLTKPSVLTTTSAFTLALKGLQTGASTDNIVVTDANGVLKSIAPSSLSTEPWYNVATKTQATANTQDIYQLGKIGIGTTTPAATLDVNGKTLTKTLEVSEISTLKGAIYAKSTAIAPESGVSQLAVDNITGEIYKVGSSTSVDAKPLNYITYTVSNVNGDWISTFDTKIPSNKYAVVVVGFAFDSAVALYNGAVPPTTVNSFIDSGTWRLAADYKNSSTATGLNGTWTITCLVINNSMVGALSGVAVDAKGLESSSVIAVPSGL